VWVGDTGQGVLCPVVAYLVLSLLCVNTVLFCPVLECVVFSLATSIARHSGWKCSDFYSWWLAQQ
jgi:uncharacterized membrane protein YvlD (DUF360 family)